MARREGGAAKVQRPSVLVLTEGSRTEPNYIDALARELGIASLQCPRNHHTSPEQLVREAIKALKADLKLEAAFVVFDRDDHASFNAAVGLAQTCADAIKPRLHLIRSDPSFEIWLLYHFEYFRGPIHRDDALRRLCEHYPKYKKGDVSCMDVFIDLLDAACENSKRALEDVEPTGNPNPSSEMHILVEKLTEFSTRW